MNIIEFVGDSDEIVFARLSEVTNNNDFVVFLDFLGGINVSELNGGWAGLLFDPSLNFSVFSSSAVFQSVLWVFFEPFQGWVASDSVFLGGFGVDGCIDFGEGDVGETG